MPRELESDTARAASLASMALVDALAARGVFAPIDRQFAQALARLSAAESDVILAAAFASRAVQNGHICVDLRQLAHNTLHDSDGEPINDVELPKPGRWLAALRASRLVGSGVEARPLILDEKGRLYLARYWAYEAKLISELRSRASAVLPVAEQTLKDSLTELFPSTAEPQNDGDLQRAAAIVVAHKRFALISGGPGTGKTHTVVKVLAVVEAQARAQGAPRPRTLLVAPTGKAAARLSESIQANLKLISDPELRARIPTEASTIHRALGYQPRTPTRFRHDAHNQLSIDTLVVDEASMVDLALLTKLVQAVPSHARLILLGDKDQLASIEAGAIFGDIYNPDAEHGFSPAFADKLVASGGGSYAVANERSASGIWDSVVHLTRSYRYAENSGIAGLARAVNRGDAEAAFASLYNRTRSDPAQLSFGFGPESKADTVLNTISDGPSLRRALARKIEAGFLDYCRERDVRQKLVRLNAFRVLCSHRRGDFGVEGLNALIERELGARGHLELDQYFYDGRPLLITQNDYQLELFNGDVGVVSHETGSPRAYFMNVSGQLRSFIPARLPPHETVFAMTVHKSQGSEFDGVLLVVPPEPSAIVTRELLYTGITRARQRIELFTSRAALRAAIKAQVERTSGLRDALWNQ